MALIAPSLLAADFTRLGEALRAIKEAGAGMVHVDVMDGHFVEDISVGQPVVRSLRKATDLVLDLHLLIERPERYVEEFLAAADRVAVHIEATTRLHEVLEVIRTRGVKAGVALKPSTPVDSIVDLVGEFDYLSILSSDPGLGERAFIPRSVEKTRAAASLRDARRGDFEIQVEGGIGFEHIELLAQAGADILVAGSAIFNSEDPKASLGEMLRLASVSPRMRKI